MAKPRPSKPPRIKKGHKTPSFKPNADEVDRRTTAVELLLSRGARRSEIHDAMRKQFNINWRTADEYTGRARKRLMDRLNKSKEDHRCESLAFYESMMRSGECKAAEKIKACQRKDELLGLDAPTKTKTELTGSVGGKIELEHKTPNPIDFAKLERVAKIVFGIPSADGNGKPLHPADTGAEAGAVPQPAGR